MQFGKYIVLLWLLLLSCTEALAGTSKTEQTFIAFSDIHFDPFYTCEKNTTPCPVIKKLMNTDAKHWNQVFQQFDTGLPSPYGQDTNYPLLQSALRAIHTQAKQSSPAFALILGDFLAHDFKEHYQIYSGDSSAIGYQNFVRKTLQFLAQQIHTALPNMPVYPAVGNNDSYTGNYNASSDGNFFKDMAIIWKPLIKNSNGTFSQTFPMAGYYSINPPDDAKLRIIVLNTVLFSKQAPDDKTSQQAAQQQLTWLKAQLKQASQKKQKVWLAFHIPPGINVYYTIKNPIKLIIPFWASAYNQNFLTILNNSDSPVVAIISSHVHMDGFQIIPAKKPIPDTFVASISPIYRNNPSFKIYSFQLNSGQFKNFISYYLSDDGIHTVWQKQYDFNQVYQSNCNVCNLLQGMEKIIATENLLRDYQRYYATNNLNAQPITEKKWLHYYWCAMNQVTQTEYQQCLQTSTQNQKIS